jgi:ATP-dependent exoDNAse (exonuclease V) beta subunit
MPVHNERDAIYAYHFFRLLQRAKNIHLIYNNTSGGIGGKEKSRFIRQIENEWKSDSVTISEKESSISISDSSLEMFTQVEKSELLKSDILDFLQKGVTPTALSEYVRNPLEFYFNKILRVREENELEEIVGYATLGVVVHDVLEELYIPFVGSFPDKEDFKVMVKRVPDLLEAKFKEHYKKGQLNEGKNLLVLQVARTMIFNFLKVDEKTSQELALKGTPIELISLEERLEKTVYLKELDIEVKLVGKADRIEKRGNDIYIIDYKTGAVEQNNLRIKELSEIFDAEKKKEKVLQLLMYAYMFDKKKLDLGNVYGAVFSLRKFSQGAMVAQLDEGPRNKTNLVFDAMLEKEFEEILLLKMCELYDGKGRFEDINVNSLEQPENQT